MFINIISDIINVNLTLIIIFILIVLKTTSLSVLQNRAPHPSQSHLYYKLMSLLGLTTPLLPLNVYSLVNFKLRVRKVAAGLVILERKDFSPITRCLRKISFLVACWRFILFLMLQKIELKDLNSFYFVA